MPMSTEIRRLIGIFYLLDESKSVIQTSKSAFGRQKDLYRKDIVY